MQSKTNTVEFRQSLKAVFDKMDDDKNGYLDHNEAANALKELGHDTTEQSLKEFFAQVDANHDGKITFEELYTWANTEGGKSINPVKLQILRLAKKANKQAKHLAKDLKDQQENISHHHIGTQAGTIDHAGTKVHACVHIGEEADTHFNAVSKDLDITENASVILQFKSPNAEKAKVGLLEVFQGAKDFAAISGMVPPELNLDDLKITASHEGDHVRIAIQMQNNSELQSVLGQLEFMASAFLGGNISGSATFDLSIKTSVGAVVEDNASGKNTSLVNLVAEGVSLNIDARIPDALVDIVRSQVAESGPDALPRDLRPLVPLLFLKQSKIQFDFNSQVKKAFPPGLDAMSFGDLLPQLKMLPIDQIGMMAPPLGQLIDLAKEDLAADLKILVRAPKSLGSLHLRSDGLGKLWDLLTSN
jgi:hypothetical protein